MKLRGVTNVLLCDRGWIVWSSAYLPELRDKVINETPWKYACDQDAMRAQFARCLATGRAEGLNLTTFPDDELRLWRAVWHRVDGVIGVRASLVTRELPVEACHLSTRQLDVLRAVHDYDTVTAACMALRITPRTWHSHIANIRETLRRNDLRQIAEWMFGEM